jgi:hypothetical protein
MTGVAGMIICGVDDSEAARDAVSVAASLAAALGRRLVLLHAAEQGPCVGVATAPYASPGLFDDAATKEAPEQLLDRLVHELGLSTSAERLVEAGDPRVFSRSRRRRGSGSDCRRDAGDAVGWRWRSSAPFRQLRCYALAAPSSSCLRGADSSPVHSYAPRTTAPLRARWCASRDAWATGSAGISFSPT